MLPPHPTILKYLVGRGGGVVTEMGTFETLCEFESGFIYSGQWPSLSA